MELNVSNEPHDTPSPGNVPSNFTFSQSIINSGVVLMANIRQAVDEALDKEKPLLVYVHNDEYDFTKQFAEVLIDVTVNDIFQFFTFFACDVDDIDTLASVELESQTHEALKPVWTSMSGREDGLFMFMTYSGSLHLQTIFDGVFDNGKMLRIYNSYCLHEKEKLNAQELVQKQCIVSAITKFEDRFGTDHVPFQSNTLEKAINESLRMEPQHQSKFLVLWFFNEDDGDCLRMASHLCSGKIRELLEHLAYLVPWDVSDNSHHRILKWFARTHFDLDIAEALIETKRNALFFFVCRNNEPRLHSLVRSSFDSTFDEDKFLVTVQELVGHFQETHQITDLVEMAAIEEFILKNPEAKYVCPKSKSLSTAIKEDCLCNHIQSRKMLLLVFSAGKDGLLDNIMNVLSTNSTSLKEQYLVIPWEISDDKKHDKLALALSRYIALENMEILLRAKRTAIFVFMPIAKSLTLFSFIDSTKTVKKITEIMSECQQFFEVEKAIEARLPGNGDSFEGAAKFQQLVYDQLGNRDYDCFRLKNVEEADSLKEKLKYAFYGPPTAENIGLKEEGKRRTRVENAYKLIVSEAKKISKHADEVVMTCIFNCLIPLPKEKLAKLDEDEEYDPQCDFTPIPVFVLRKCTRCPSANPCRIFIDQDLRVYQSFNDYLENNKLPRCLFLVPKNGKYQGDIWGNVRLEYKLSPACGIGPVIVKAMDIGSLAVGTSAGIVGIVASVPALPVVAPVVVTGALIAGISVGVYSFVRGSMTIHDRICHREDMSIFNSEARGAYINIVAGTLGLGLYARGAVTGATILIGGSRVTHLTFDDMSRWVSEDEIPSSLATLQLLSSILFFEHAIAGTIVGRDQFESLRERRALLRSNRLRKPCTKKTIKVGDSVETDQEVIAYIKKLDNHNEVLQVLISSKKKLEKLGLRLSVNGGELRLNGLAVNISEVSNMSRMQHSEKLLNLPSMESATPKQVNVVKNMFSKRMANSNLPEIVRSALQLCLENEFLMKMCAKMLNMFSDYVADKLLFFMEKFLVALGANYNLNQCFLRIFPQVELPLMILKLLIDFFKEAYCQRAENNVNENIIMVLEGLIYIANLSPSSLIQNLLVYAVKWIAYQIYDKFCGSNQSYGDTRNRVLCTQCSGYYYK